MAYRIIDRETGAVVASAKTRKAALRKADKLDNQFGSYRFYIRSSN